MTVAAMSTPRAMAMPASQADAIESRAGIDWRRIGTVGAIVGLLAYCIFPFLWLARLSMDPSASGTLLPRSFTLANYAEVVTNPVFLNGFMNSVIVAGSATALAMVIGGGAGYALARLPVPGRQYILFCTLAVSMFPAISIIAPIFELWRSIGLFDTRLGLILPNVTFALPMSIWTMSSFFRELPRDLEQAAYMDGATPFQAFRMVMLPLAAPGVFTAAILVFIGTWNEFLFSISLSATSRSQTIPAVISSYQGKSSYEIPVGAISAASIVVMIPLLIIVLACQRRIVAGLTAGGVKG